MSSASLLFGKYLYGMNEITTQGTWEMGDITRLSWNDYLEIALQLASIFLTVKAMCLML